MVLNELLGVKKLSTDTIATAMNRWIRDGKIRVRSGSFAFVVVPKDEDFVYKVWTDDPGWEKYLEYVKAHQGNKHLIRLFGRVKNIPFTFKRPKDFDATLKIVKIEKLNELETSDLDAHGLISGLTSFMRKADVDKLTYDDIPEINKRVRELSGVEKDLDASFLKTVIDVVQARGPLFNDFHAQNVMKRPDGTLVITDPYFMKPTNNMINITAADVLQGKFYGKHDTNNSKSGR